MPFFRVDDTFHSHPKTVALLADPDGGQAAVGTWALCGSWCGEQLTNGRLSLAVVVHHGGTEAQAEALIRARLWERRKGAYLFHNWKKWNPTKEQTLAKRKANAERVSRWRNEHACNGVTNGVTGAFVTPPPSRSRPVPKEEKKSADPSALRRANSVPSHHDTPADGLKTGPSAEREPQPGATRWTEEHGQQRYANGKWGPLNADS